MFNPAGHAGCETESKRAGVTNTFLIYLKQTREALYDLDRLVSEGVDGRRHCIAVTLLKYT